MGERSAGKTALDTAGLASLARGRETIRLMLCPWSPIKKRREGAAELNL